MKFVFATLAATASALPWEKEVACGFDAACGFDVVIDEATGCGFDAGMGVGSGWGSGGTINPDDGAGDRGGNSGCTGCAACKKNNNSCQSCTGGCPTGTCENGAGCRNGSCGNAGNGGNDWCIGGTDCETSPDMVCAGNACDSWCPNASVQCILNCLPDDFSPCCAFEAPHFAEAKNMVLRCIGRCNKTGPRGDLMGYMSKVLGKGWRDGCCGCYCNFGCNCDCSGNCGPCGCSSCSGNCNVDGSNAGASPYLSEESAEKPTGGSYDAREEQRVDSKVGGHYINYAAHYRREKTAHLAKDKLRLMYGSEYANVLKGSFDYAYIPHDVQCGFDAKTQQWVDIKCGFDNNCGFDFECGFDAECGFDVVKNTKCGFDLAREQLGCGFDAKSNSFVNVQCGFDNNCGFDIKA